MTRREVGAPPRNAALGSPSWCAARRVYPGRVTEISDGLRRIFLAAPFIADLGIRLDSVEAGRCTTSLEIAPRHLQQDGFVHAGVQATMADHTAGAAAATQAAAGQIVLTVEFKINLLRPAEGERLVCRARVLKPGSRFSIVESEVFGVVAGQERLVSKTTATIAMVEAPR